MLSVNCRFGAVIEYGRVLAGGMTGLASQTADTMALESATAADRPGAMTVTALTGLPARYTCPDRFRLTGRGESHRLSRWAGRLSCPAPSIPVSHDSTEGADPGVSLLLQPSWLPGLPGRVGHLHPHLASRLSCGLSRNLTGSWPRRGDPAAGCPGPQTLISVLVTQNRYPDSPACDARGRRETMTTSTGPLAACRRRRLRPEPGRLAQHSGQPARLGRACGSGY